MLQEKFEDIKGVIRSRNRRTDNTLDKRKMANNDVQNTAQKTKDRPTTGTELAFSEGLAVLAPHVPPVVLLLHGITS